MAIKQKLVTSEYIKLLSVHFLIQGAFSIYFFLPQFVRATGGTEFIIGIVMGASAVSGVIFRLPAGGWIDRFGSRKLAILGTSLFAVSAALPIFASSAGFYLITARCVLGAAMVIYFTSVVTLFADLAPPDRRAEALAIFGAAGFIATAVFPYFCEQLLIIFPYSEITNFRILFGIATMLCIGSTIIATNVGLSSRKRPCKEKTTPDHWFRVFKKPAMLFLFLPSLAFGAGYTAITSFVTDFTSVCNLGPTSSYFLSYSVVIIVLRVTTGKLLDRIDRRYGVVFALVAMTIGLYYASISRDSFDLIVMGLLTGLGHCYIFPSLSTMTYDSSEPHNRGTSMALYMMGFDTSLVLFTPLLGRVAQHWDYFAMYRVAAASVFLGLIVYLFGLRHHSPEAIADSAELLTSTYRDQTGEAI